MTITLGEILTIVTILASVAGAAFWLGRCLQRLDSDKVSHRQCSERRKEAHAEADAECLDHRAQLSAQIGPARTQ